MDKCIVCKKELGGFFVLSQGIKQKDQGTIHFNTIDFKYLEEGQSAHLECYIDLAVQKSINKVNNG